MTKAEVSSLVAQARETVVVGMAAICVGTAVYTFLGFAWTVKLTVETGQKLRHPFS